MALTPTRIYLDNAATSWPKPTSVYDAVDRYQRTVGAAAGRGTYREAIESHRAIDEARAAVARLIGASEPKRIVFTSNGTEALNLAIHGLVHKGQHVVTSVVEHNSVLRPLHHLEAAQDVEVTRVGCDAEGTVCAEEVLDALRPNTALVALIHASNVTGTLQPIAEIGRRLKDHQARFLVDAAQTLGHMPLDVNELGADLLAAPGHKGLLGPLGTGLLYVGPGVEERLACLRQGGTGTLSEEDVHPTTLPEKYESGNANVPGLVGLAAGVSYLQEQGADQIQAHGRQLLEALIAGLSAIPGITVLGPKDVCRRLPVVSLLIEGYDPQEAAAALDAVHGIQTPRGFHCASLVHRTLGTANDGGTLRLSPGPFTSLAEIEKTVAAIRHIASAQLAT